MAQETQVEVLDQKKKRGRSPSYPAISLPEAITRARTIYQHDKVNWAHIDSILGHWRYKPKSGAGLVVVAALKKFGLLEDRGSGQARTARLTPLAYRILIDDVGSDERNAAIRNAALMPSIHRDLWDMYDGALPSDQTLRRHLIFERNFTERGADEFLAEFRDTITFIQDLSGDSISVDEQDKAPLEPEVEKMTTAPAASHAAARPAGASRQPAPPDGMRAVPLPISAGEWPTLYVSYPMSEEAWEQMMTVLNAMKAGIVRDDGDTGD